MAKIKAYLTKGIEIIWKCDKSLVKDYNIEEKLIFKFPNGIVDFLHNSTSGKSFISSENFFGSIPFNNNRIDWVMNWLGPSEDGFLKVIVTQ